ncbi:unnamed protein product [Oikopleura dioica]|uniref:Deoxyhypusine hydroxylase n=1 Tax=Oikopleura dioica TaxID=34765 RepID=E4XIP3_OIKDI|nr:unnamed protein product [Oikopleura dioica]
MNGQQLDELITKYSSILNNFDENLARRFRALFSLKGLGTDRCIEEMGKAFADSSELLKHEVAYCLGQTKSDKALEILKSCLNDMKQEPVVRHEAVEAIGAIGPPDYLALLKDLAVNDRDVEVRETSELAFDRIKFFEENPEKKHLMENRFNSVDPAPRSEETNLAKLREALMDTKLSLFERYRAMFGLRDILPIMETEEEKKECIEALLNGFNEKKSALFRHEIAFVFGQLGDVAAHGTARLAEVVDNELEHGMVRHEAAEALGNMGNEMADICLKKHRSSAAQILRESCEVALDQSEYYENNTEFQPISA